MKHSIKTGICFGLTSGVITTLGLIVGLHSFTGSKLIIIGGILTIAIADAFSDAFGIHISEESEQKHETKEIWESTISTFLAKLFVALTFIVPTLLFDFSIAILASVGWGLVLLALLSYNIAKSQKIKPWKVIIEHLIIALIVVFLTHYVGDMMASFFG